MYDIKKIIITFCIAFAIGAICTSLPFIAIGGSDNRRLNTELGASRADLAALSEQYNAIKQSNFELGKRLDSITAGVAEAKRLAGQLSVSGESASNTIRRVIENLRKIKVILADF